MVRRIGVLLVAALLLVVISASTAMAEPVRIRGSKYFVNEDAAAWARDHMAAANLKGFLGP